MKDNFVSRIIKLNMGKTSVSTQIYDALLSAKIVILLYYQVHL